MTQPKRSRRVAAIKADAATSAAAAAASASETDDGSASEPASGSSSTTRRRNLGQSNRRNPRTGRGGNGDRVTRSRNAKLTNGLEDPEQVERELTAQLRAMSLYAANTIGDGNCLFRALSDQLYGYPDLHAVLREGVCNYLAAKPEKFAGFVDVEKSYDDYVKTMRQNGTYGGHLELSAFAQQHQKEIKIMQPGLVYIVSPVDDGEDASASVEREKRELERREVQLRTKPGSEAPPPSERDVRRRRRERKASRGAGDPGPSTVAAAAALAASTTPLLAPAEDDTDGTTFKQPEAWGPLYIAYHNWEHYSSIRNIDGPHTGLPRIRERATTNAAASGSGSAKAAEADEGPAEATQDEQLLRISTDEALTVRQARFLIKQHNGSWESALEAWQANALVEAAEADALVGAAVHAEGEAPAAAAAPVPAPAAATGEAAPDVTMQSQPTSSLPPHVRDAEWRASGDVASSPAHSVDTDAASVDASTTATTAGGDGDEFTIVGANIVTGPGASLPLNGVTSPTAPRFKRAASKDLVRDAKRRSGTPPLSMPGSDASTSSDGTVSTAPSTAVATAGIAQLQVGSDEPLLQADVSMTSMEDSTNVQPARRRVGRPRKDGREPGTVPRDPGLPPTTRMRREAQKEKRKLRTEASRKAKEEERRKERIGEQKADDLARTRGLLELHI